MHAIESGFFNKEETNYELFSRTCGSYLASIANKTFNHLLENDQTIKLEELLRGHFVILFAGYLVVIVVFVCEIFNSLVISKLFTKYKYFFIKSLQPKYRRKAKIYIKLNKMIRQHSLQTKFYNIVV